MPIISFMTKLYHFIEINSPEIIINGYQFFNILFLNKYKRYAKILHKIVKFPKIEKNIRKTLDFI